MKQLGKTEKTGEIRVAEVTAKRGAPPHYKKSFSPRGNKQDFHVNQERKSWASSRLRRGKEAANEKLNYGAEEKWDEIGDERVAVSNSF